jgi:hypothetical protein
MLLPVFGGAIGGAIAGGIMAATAPSSSGGYGGHGATRSSSSLRWVFAILFILVGGFFALGALVLFCDTWKIAQRVPEEVTAAELLRTKDAKSPPAPWIAYSFGESKPTKLTVTRRRLGHGGEVKASCLLVRVEDKWLLASVAPGFEDSQLVGRLVPLDSSSQALIEQIPKAEPKSDAKPLALLPYEFNGVDGSASDQQGRYIGAAGCGVLGLLGLLVGLRLACGKRRAARTNSAAATPWTFHPVPAGK